MPRELAVILLSYCMKFLIGISDIVKGGGHNDIFSN